MQYQTRANPIKIDAWQWRAGRKDIPDWVLTDIKLQKIQIHKTKHHGTQLTLHRSDGVLNVVEGRYIIRYPSGNLSHLHAADFKYSFEEVK